MRQVVGCRHRICFFQNELAAVFFPLLIFIAAVTEELICKGIGGVIPAFVGEIGLGLSSAGHSTDNDRVIPPPASLDSSSASVYSSSVS